MEGSSKTFSHEDKVKLLTTCCIPEWWDKELHFITYEFLGDIYDISENIEVDQATIKNSLLALDPGLVLPNKFANLKKKIRNQLRKKNFNSQQAAEFLYNREILNYVGENCDKFGITQSLLAKVDCGAADLHFQKLEELTNGVVLELFKFKNVNSYSSVQFKNWLFCLVNNDVDNNVDVLSRKVERLAAKKNELTAGKKKEELSVFLQAKFCFPVKQQHVVHDIQREEKMEMERLLDKSQEKIIELMDEIDLLNMKIEALNEVIIYDDQGRVLAEDKVDVLESEIEDVKRVHNEKTAELLKLVDKLQPYSKKNIERVIKRREDKVKNLTENLELTKKHCEARMGELTASLNDLSSDNSVLSNRVLQLTEELSNALQRKDQHRKMKWYYKKLFGETELINMNLNLNVHENCEREFNELKGKCDYLENRNAELVEELTLMRNNKILTKENRRFTDDVRATYQDLVALGVGQSNVEAVVSSVLKNIAKVSYESLPKSTFANQMFLESRRLSQIQVAEKLVENHETSNRTLHSDGTTKVGRKYGVYDIVSDDGTSLVTGLREMASGDTQTQLDVLQSILKEVEDSLVGSVSDVEKKIVQSIKNVMSDRHIVQKKFNKIFQEYRATVLPDVIKDWANLSEEVKTKIKQVNEFFCGMHYVVGLADQTETALKAWEKLLFDDMAVGSIANGGYSKGESGTYRLVRTVCKAVQTRGCEKSGRVGDFEAFMKEELGFPSVPLIPFKGNRFNVLFYNGGMCFYLRNHLKSFFDDVNDENKLLKAVHYDLEVPAFIAGCRALGFVNKFVTGPLWRLLESDLHIFRMNEYYQHMEKLFTELAEDATSFLKGEVFFFEDTLITRDAVYNDLIKPSENDEATKQCLELIFGSLSIITKRMLQDHLEGGKYTKHTEEMVKETASVGKTNTLSERNFGMVDRLMREKPYSNLITLEAIIMARTNKMSKWRDDLSPEKRSLVMKWARESVKTQYNDFKNRRSEVQKEVNEKRFGKIEEKRRRSAKLSLAKENLCHSIHKYNGLWNSAEQVDEELSNLTDEKEKREALKCQIQFRQKIILSCDSVDKKLFYLSHNGVMKSSDEICANLKVLIDQLKKDNGVATSHSKSNNMLTILPRNKLESEKNRLKDLLSAEVKKNLERGMPPKTKRRKLDKKANKKADTIPIITSMEELVGKRVEHFIFDYDGKERWCQGTVVAIKPETELVIRYDTEENLFSFHYSEFVESSVRALSVKPADFVGKSIRQKFTKDDDDWWEVGNVISYDEDSKNFTVNFDGYDEEGYNDSDVVIYPVIDDYLNHDIQFL